MDKKKAEIVIVTAVSKVFNYLNHNPHATDEEVMSNVIAQIKESRELKRVAVAGISRALKYREEALNEKEIMQKVLDDVDEILRGIEESEEKPKKLEGEVREKAGEERERREREEKERKEEYEYYEF